MEKCPKAVVVLLGTPRWHDHLRRQMFAHPLHGLQISSLFTSTYQSTVARSCPWTLISSLSGVVGACLLSMTPQGLRVELQMLSPPPKAQLLFFALRLTKIAVMAEKACCPLPGERLLAALRIQCVMRRNPRGGFCPPLNFYSKSIKIDIFAHRFPDTLRCNSWQNEDEWMNECSALPDKCSKVRWKWEGAVLVHAAFAKPPNGDTISKQNSASAGEIKHSSSLLKNKPLVFNCFFGGVFCCSFPISRLHKDWLFTGFNEMDFADTSSLQRQHKWLGSACAQTREDLSTAGGANQLSVQKSN